MNTLEQKVFNTINKHKMIDRGRKLLVAFSGGADSTALLLLLHKMSDSLGVSIAAAHINHNLREGARRDEDFCRRLCHEIAVPLFVLDADVSTFARQNKLGTEEAGRLIRYRFLRETAKAQVCNKIATAHHLNDSAESMLLNLFRGSGLNGLLGIPPVNGEIIRPLIICSRAEILDYLENTPYCVDETNGDSSYRRNVVRNGLMPEIEKTCPDFCRMAARTIELLTEQNTFLEDEAEKAFNACAKCESSSVSLNLWAFTPLHTAIKRRVIRLAVSRIRGLYNLSETNTGDILRLFDRQTGSTLNLPGGVIAEKLSGGVRIRLPITPAPSAEYAIKLGVTGAPEFGLKIYANKLPVKEKVIYTFEINYGRIVGNLVLRTRRPGDYLNLVGVGRKSLSDFLIDAKIPRSERDYIPLFTIGSEIAVMNGIVHGHYDTAAPGERLITVSVTEERDGNNQNANSGR